MTTEEKIKWLTDRQDFLDLVVVAAPDIAPNTFREVSADFRVVRQRYRFSTFLHWTIYSHVRKQDDT